MPFTRDDGPNLRAEKLIGAGALYYSTWSDEHGNRYVRVEENVGGGPSNGTFSSNLYPLDAIGGQSAATGIIIETGQQVVSQDKNMSGFLRAILNDINRRANAE